MSVVSLTPVGLVIVGLALTTIALLAAPVVRAGLTANRRGRVLMLLAAFLLPGFTLAGAVNYNMRAATEVSFCLSCHEMGPYGASLESDDDEILAAVHRQNHLVQPDEACYACHSDYTLFGPIKAKLNGIKHVYVHYLGNIPEKIELYKPYNTSVCLHCHEGAKSFETGRFHNRKEGLLASIKSGEKSCLSSGCHEAAHSWEDEE